MIRTGPRRLLVLFLGIALAVIALFAGVELIYPGWYADTLNRASRPSPWSGAVTTGLLALDIVLPTPSTLVMALNGRVFGALVGSILNLSGCLLGGGLAFGAGRMFKPWVLRSTRAEDRDQANLSLKKYGLMALVLSRPIPVMAETVAVTASAAGMKPGRYFLGILLGALPVSFAYGLAGAFARGPVAGPASLLAILVISWICWRKR